MRSAQCGVGLVAIVVPETVVMTAADPLPPASIAWADGNVLPARDATVPLTDDGFLRGDAIFEGVMVRRGCTHALEDHLERMGRSAHNLDLQLPVDELRQAAADLVAAWPADDGALKLIVTRGGVVRGMLESMSWPASIKLAVVEMPWRNALSGTKTLSYAVNQWALRRARAQGADDALIVDDGVVMELPTGSICVVIDGAIKVNDPARVPVLDSITVHHLAEVSPIHRGVITRADLDRSQELFVVSATRAGLSVHTVIDVDGTERHFPAPGPITADVTQRLRDHIDATLDPKR